MPWATATQALFGISLLTSLVINGFGVYLALIVWKRISSLELVAMVQAALDEADRFARESGFFTVVIGTGGLTQATTPIDLSDLDGLGVASNWSARYAGLYDPSQRDLYRLSANSGLERLATREEILSLFGGAPGEGARLPDVMAFEVLTADTRLAGARLDMEEVPVRLRCRACGKEFQPEQHAAPFAPCPHCGEELGHTVLSGRELFIEYLELE